MRRLRTRQRNETAINARSPRAMGAVVLLAFGVLATLGGCRKRTFGDGETPTSASVRSSAASGGDATDLKDDAAFLRGEGPLRKVGHHLFFEAGRTTEDRKFGLFQTAEGPGVYALYNKRNNWEQGTFSEKSRILTVANILNASRSHVDIEKGLGNVERPFGAATVLKTLRKNREQVSKWDAQGNSQTSAPLFGMRGWLEANDPKFAANEWSVYEITDPKKPFTSTMCRNHVRSYIGDVKWHYTCQIPALFRACYRRIVGLHYDRETAGDAVKAAQGRLALDAFVGTLRQVGLDDHKYTVAFCREGQDLSFLPPDTLQMYENTVSREPLPVYRKAFESFYTHQEVDLGNGVRVNMFDHIMTSATFDFPYEEQQRVLNAFYGDLKPKVDAQGNTAPPFDPLNKKDCLTYREPRLEVEKKDGSHCRADSQKIVNLYSIGR